jgi:hypothetical protein
MRRATSRSAINERMQSLHGASYAKWRTEMQRQEKIDGCLQGFGCRNERGAP